MTSTLYDADHLYRLLPEVYRLRDRPAGSDAHPGRAEPTSGPLYDLVTLLAREAQVVARDIERLHENSFVETCEPWAVPYLGDLLGVEGLRDDAVVSARAEVAHTLGYRKRKGTAAVLEQLARDVTGWPARVVEAFELLAWSQYVPNHVRRHAVATAHIRDAAAMERVDGPFDRAAHTVDVGRVEPREGRSNLGHVVLHLFRLYALPQVLTTPHPQAAADDDAEIGPTRFRFSPLGHDAPLFTHPEAETGPASIAQERHLPVPIGRRMLHADLEAESGAGGVDGEAEGGVYVSASGSITVLVPETGPGADGWQPLAARYVACNLEDWDRPLPSTHEPEQVGGVVAIDPVLGRLRFENGERMPEVFRLASYHGLPDRLGGGQYDRSPLAPVDEIAEAQRFWVGDGTDLLLVHRDDIDTTSPRFFDQLEAALAQPWPDEGDRLVEIVDSRTYDLALDRLEIPAGRRLVVRAEDRQRPTVVLGAPLVIEGGEDARLEIDGLWITGAELRVEAPEEGGETLPGLDRLALRHVTLVPGHSLDAEGQPVQPGAASLRVETGETEIEIERSISGAIEAAAETTISIADSVIDADGISTQSEPEVAVALGGLGGDAGAFGGQWTIRRSTILGRVLASALQLGENSLFLGDALAERRQEGCVRYSWVTPRSRVPRPYRCQPALAVAALREKAEAEAAPMPDPRRVETRLRPRFVRRRYGRPAYAQLDWRLGSEILRGADDGSEMGAYCSLQGPLREDDLRRRLAEYLPASLEAGIFYGT